VRGDAALPAAAAGTPNARRHDGGEHGRRGLADLHMHTNYSDGTGSVEEVLAFAEHHTTLDVIAITDHDTIEGALRARDLAAQREYRFEVIVGEEISTREGHLLALFLRHPIRASSAASSWCMSRGGLPSSRTRSTVSFVTVSSGR
jgi:hypothetical protein